MEHTTNSAGEQRTGLPCDLPLERRRSRGWQLETAGSGWEALERVHAGPGPDLILLDLRDGDSDGLHSLRWLRRVRPDLPVLVLADSRRSQQKTEAIRLGAQDFLVQPLRAAARSRHSALALRFGATASRAKSLIDEIEHIGDDMFFVAASPTMRKLRAQAELLAQVSAPVFILGENGSGKELAARLIHKLSVRSGFRFLKLNCATFRAMCWRASSSAWPTAMDAAGPASWNCARAARCFSMKSRKCR